MNTFFPKIHSLNLKYYLSFYANKVLILKNDFKYKISKKKEKDNCTK